MRNIATLGFLVLLCGCVGAPTPAPVGEPLAPGVGLILPDKPVFAAGIEVNQLVQARFQERHQMFQSFIESGTNRFSIVMSVPSGPRIMKINWFEGSVSAQKEPTAPDALSPRRMLADLLLVYAPADVLRAALKGAALEEDVKGTRKIVKDGASVIVVTRPSGDVWNGRSALVNYAFDYELNIQSQRVTP
tara:strand:+ start:1499 stop:2068 length:570 start_codon:yes stop_codon:yes gene_type:complete